MLQHHSQIKIEMHRRISPIWIARCFVI